MCGRMSVMYVCSGPWSSDNCVDVAAEVYVSLYMPGLFDTCDSGVYVFMCLGFRILVI